MKIDSLVQLVYTLCSEAAESTINTISLIVVFPITFSNCISKISKKKVKNVPNDSKQYY